MLSQGFRTICCALACFVLTAILAYPALGKEPAKSKAPPLHQRIDAAIEAAWEGPYSPLCDDAEFIRRVYLDLLGTIPATDEVRQFLADPAADKRERLIDALFDRPEHARHLANVFDVLWMERRASKYVKPNEWHDYLLQAFGENRPYHELVREILLADGADCGPRGAARFLLDRECEPNAVVRDVGRMFFGRDLQCAQCHDHPLVDEYEQKEYYGLYAFVSRSFVFLDAKKTGVVAEKADGEANYKSVFTGDSDDRVIPRLPLGEPLEEPVLEKGQEYEVAPAKNVRPIPKYSRRAELARRATSGENAAFNRNAVNRLWAHLFGRGIVHPVEFHHRDNPPSHPELLELLADDFVQHDFDVRYLLGQLARTRAYQRSSLLPESAAEVPADRFATMALKPLSAEALAQSTMQATGTWALRQASALAAIEKKPPPELAESPEERRPAMMARLVEQQTYESSRSQITSFVSLYATAAEEDFQATVNQALFFANGSVVDGWLKPGSKSLTGRLAAIESPDELIEELFLSVLSRYPTAEERQLAGNILAESGADRTAAIRDLAWGLLSSTEFRFNH